MILAVVMEKQPLNEGLKTDHFPTLFDIKPTGFGRKATVRGRFSELFGAFVEVGLSKSVKVILIR